MPRKTAPKSSAAPQDLVYVAIAALVLSELNPRKTINDEGIEKLADAIGASGQLNTPITVRPQQNGTYEVIAGERRTRALRKLVERGTFEESKLIRAVSVECDDSEALAIALSENADREDIHPMEQADGYAQLSMRGLSAKDISVRLGKDVKIVAEMLKLAKDIAPLTRKLFLQGVLNTEKAMALVQFSSDDQQGYLERHRRVEYDRKQLVEISPEEAEELAAADVEYFHDYSGFYAIPEGVHPVISYDIYSAETIYNDLKSVQVPVKRAKFDLKEYEDRGGKIGEHSPLFADDPSFSGDKFFIHRELFSTMQKEAMEDLAEQATTEGFRCWVVEKQPVYNKIWKDHDGYRTYWMDPNGEIRFRDNFGPTVLMSEEESDKYIEEVTKKEQKGGGDSAPKVNRKRLQIEDRAINQAVEHALFTDVRLQNVMMVLSYLGLDGLRLDVSANFMNPHEGYHAPEVVEVVEGFYNRLRGAGIPLTGRHGSKEGEPLLGWDGMKGYRAAKDGEEPLDYKAATRAILLDMTDEALEQLVRAFFVLSLTPVHDGVTNPMHELVLAQTNADPTDYFTADESYLKACKNAELEGIFADLNASGNFGTVKKDNVNFLLSNIKGRYSQWIPERLRAYVPETGAEVIPDQPPVEGAENVPAAA